MTSSLQTQDIGIVILAAGTSQRFEGDKRQALMRNGLGLLENTLANIPSTFSKRLLVLQPDDDKLADNFSSQGWEICIAEDATQGMGNSLAAAISAQNNWQGLIIGLGDMPFIKGTTYSAIQTALCNNEIVVPMYDGQRGNPVGFQVKYFAELGALRGDQGARNLLKENVSLCYQLMTDDQGILKDIDTSHALEEFS
jgi:molybdenum cofactor cytidylyltransferase